VSPFEWGGELWFLETFAFVFTHFTAMCDATFSLGCVAD
jgi:hypothetical protein